MSNLSGKKLLFLGGSMLDRHAMLVANAMGVQTVIANFYSSERSPAKEIADKSFDMDNTNEKEMLSLIKRENIDGIFGGYTDSGLENYERLCELAGFPCYGTKEQFRIAVDKIAFKEMCRRHGVLTVEEYDPESITEDCAEFPLFVKPTDSSGSRGCSLCSDYNEYLKSVKLAMDFSPSKHITVEKYYDYHKYGDFMACYSLRDGVITLASLGDRVLYQGEGNISPLPAQLMYPSKYIDVYLESVDPKVIRMFKEEGFRNGTLFLQGFTDGKDFRFFEMGYRQNGSQQFVLTDYFNKTNALKEAIRFALTGSVDTSAPERDDARFPQPACNLVIYLQQGVVGKITGIEDVLQMPEVINYTPWIREGDTVGAKGTLGQSLLRFHVIGRDETHLANTIGKIRNIVKVYDDCGAPMVIEL